MAPSTALSALSLLGGILPDDAISTLLLALYSLSRSLFSGLLFFCDSFFFSYSFFNFSFLFNNFFSYSFFDFNFLFDNLFSLYNRGLFGYNLFNLNNRGLFGYNLFNLYRGLFSYNFLGFSSFLSLSSSVSLSLLEKRLSGDVEGKDCTLTFVKTDVDFVLTNHFDGVGGDFNPLPLNFNPLFGKGLLDHRVGD